MVDLTLNCRTKTTSPHSPLPPTAWGFLPFTPIPDSVQPANRPRHRAHLTILSGGRFHGPQRARQSPRSIRLTIGRLTPAAPAISFCVPLGFVHKAQNHCGQDRLRTAILFIPKRRESVGPHPSMVRGLRGYQVGEQRDSANNGHHRKPPG
jgi:hypothetical protein